ncbi:MAG: sulfatase [Colwellia sp.]|nr:sulfatase [Colwellia sp.]
MKLIQLLAVVSFLQVSSVAFATQSGSNKNSATPNIIFILSDDMGKQDLSLYGSQLHETPNIDGLARDGIRFDNAYSAHPRCVPSRIAMLSGQDSARNGNPITKRKHKLLPNTVTFAEHLQKSGYKTGYIGKWHLGKKDGGWPEHQGFDENMLAGSAGLPDNYFYPWGGKSKNGKATFDHIKGEKGEFITERLATEAEGFIERHQDKPFLLVLSHYSVHTPIQAREQDADYYRNKLNRMGIEPSTSKHMPDLLKGKNGISEYKSQQNNPRYAAMVGSVDKSVGRVIQKLKDLGLEKNTVVIFTSDHGGLSSRGPNQRELGTSNLPYRQGKGWLYDGGIRVPLIVKWPTKIEGNSISSTQVTGTDHYPTILQLANLSLSPTDHIDGVSYLNALKGEQYTRPAFYYHSPLGRPGSTGDTNASAVIDGDWKLIDWFDENRVELFNIRQDIGEQHDLSTKHPEKLAELKIKLANWLQDTNAQYRKPGKKAKWDLPKNGHEVSNKDGKFKW